MEGKRARHGDIQILQLIVCLFKPNGNKVELLVYN